MIQVLEKLKDAADKAALDASKKHGLSASYNVVDIEPLPDDIWKILFDETEGHHFWIDHGRMPLIIVETVLGILRFHPPDPGVVTVKKFGWGFTGNPDGDTQEG